MASLLMPTAQWHSETTPPTVDGWIGFGVGETTSGSMPGADIMLSYIDDSGLQVGDFFTTDFARPEQDCTQPSDWEGVGYERNSTHTTVALQRPVGAVGNHDRDISTRSDGARLLFAYGDLDWASPIGIWEWCWVDVFSGLCPSSSPS